MKKTFLVALMLAGCAAPGFGPYQAEVSSYKDYLESEVTSGRMTKEEGRYRWEAKIAEVRQRQYAGSNTALMGGAAGMQTVKTPVPGAAPLPPAPTRTQCVPNGAGGMSCTTF